MYGEKAIELIKTLRTKLVHLPAYNESAVRDIINEINTLVEANIAHVSDPAIRAKEPDSSLFCAPIVHDKFIHRNKRCVLAYLYARTEHGIVQQVFHLLSEYLPHVVFIFSANRLARIREMWWEIGSVIPQEILVNMSLFEKEYFNEYDSMMMEYNGHYPELDLTVDQEPPKDLNVQIRVLQDCADLTTERGEVKLERGTQHHLRRADVAALIRRGLVEQVHSKET